MDSSVHMQGKTNISIIGFDIHEVNLHLREDSFLAADRGIKSKNEMKTFLIFYAHDIFNVLLTSCVHLFSNSILRTEHILFGPNSMYWILN